MVPMPLPLLVLMLMQDYVQTEGMSRRFLFNSSSTSPVATPTTFCRGYCPISCSAGYVISNYGCYLCQCASAGSQGSGNGHVYLPHPCHPAFRYCGLKCNYGFLTGQNGCQHCACATPSRVQNIPTPVVSVITVTVPYLPPVVLYHTPPIPAPWSRTVNPTTPITMTHPTTATTMATTIQAPSTPVTVAPPSAGYVDPCIPSQPCRKACDGNYVLGPEECQYCICDGTHSHQQKATTLATLYNTTDDGRGGATPVPPTTDPAVQSETCSIAQTICQMKCPGGMQISPADCLHCTCTGQNPEDGNHVTTPRGTTTANPAATRPPTSSGTPDKCAIAINLCERHCADGGYLTDPDECTLCVCKKDILTWGK